MELNSDTSTSLNDLKYKVLADGEILKKSTYEIIKVIPNDCFIKDSWKTWKAVIENYFVIVLTYILLSVSPWYAYPPMLLIIGTAFAGLFILAHDCGHYSFSDSIWVNDIAGQFFLLPLLYPFETWRIRHNCHHAHTNKLGGKSWKQFLDVRDRKADIAWFPLRNSLWDKLSSKQKLIFWISRGPLWCMAFLYNWFFEEFTLNSQTPLSDRERLRVKFSIITVICFATIFFPVLYFYIGFIGIIIYWFIPWLIYHFWLSTFTRIYHSSIDVPCQFLIIICYPQMNI